MLKKIQKYLLINHPLLWNLKIVPVTFCLLIFNIIFFLIGFNQGKLDFSESQNNYNFNDGTIIFFSILIAIISFIIWIVLYFKNNSFKSYYPKKSFSLFKEWICVFIISFLITTFIVSFLVGKDVRVRSYYTEKEAKKLCETLSLGSYFLENSYENYEYTTLDTVQNDTGKTVIPIKNNYVIFNSKKYGLQSLLNKNLSTFTFFSQSDDSLHKIKIKNWLVNNQKDSVQLLFKNYLAISKEHGLLSNIDDKKWLQLTFDYPSFENYKNIGKKESDYNAAFYATNQNKYETASTQVALPKIDTASQYIKIIGKQEYVFNKYFVPADKLEFSYNKISESYNHPSINFDTFIIPIYVALALSLLVFTYRVTSRRNWLIALISLGIINIIIGIFSAISSSGIFYLMAVGLLTLGLFIYFVLILTRKKGKGISGITLNALLWLLPTFIPVIYYLFIEFLKISSNYYSLDYKLKNKSFPLINSLEENSIFMFYVTILFVITSMIYFSFSIKKWKGLAES